MKASLCGGIAALLLSASAAEAQTAPAGEARASPAEPSARALVLSRRYIELMKPYQTIDSTLGAMTPLPGAAAAEMESLREELRSMIQELTPRIIELSVITQARVYTEAELEALVRFYETPVGRSIAAKSPQAAVATQEALALLHPAIQARTLAWFCRRHPDGPMCGTTPARPSNTTF
jgi:hypothetical protein